MELPPGFGRWSLTALSTCAYNGQDSRWYQSALRERAGRISVAGLTKDVIFEPIRGPINDRIDDAYRAKYSGSPYLDPMVSERARSATVKITPSSMNSH